jgi:uncharacterized protein
MARSMLDAIMKLSPTVQVIDLADVGAQAHYGVVAFFGSPDAAAKQKLEYRSPALAFAALAKAAGEAFSAAVPVEIGAVNSLTPMLMAAKQGIPVVDCDGAGRAVPTLTTTIFAAQEVPVAPTVMAAEDGEEAIFYVPNAADAESLGIAVVETTAFKDIGPMAMWAMTGATLQGTAVAGGLARAQRIGATLRAARERGADPVGAVLEALGGDGALVF